MSSTFWLSGKSLDRAQTKAVEAIPPLDSFLLTGPAGSGKTNILLLRAKRLKLMKLSDFKLIVFTRSLREFLREGCSLYGIPAENVVTAMQFFKELLGEYNIQFTPTGEFEADRVQLAGLVMSLIDSRGLNDGSYSAIFVDEAQDYTDTELFIFRKLTKCLVLAADLRQSIYRNTQTPGLLSKLVEKEVVELKYHYRSGLALCKVADEIYRDSAAFPSMHRECRYDEDAMPSAVEAIQCISFDEQCRRICERLSRQLKLYPSERIGVLFPKREQREDFETVLEASGLDVSTIWVDTIHRSKGLEFRAVHVGGCEVLSRMGPTQKRLIYTAILRGRTAASIFYTGHLPGYLESALAILGPPPSIPELDDLFGA
jgi:superfamily I DNA and RNA helicase